VVGASGIEYYDLRARLLEVLCSWVMRSLGADGVGAEVTNEHEGEDYIGRQRVIHSVA
jgi:hypothetical protein